MSEIIYLKPLFSPRPWGGNALTKYGFTLPANTKIGEAWVISAMEGGKASVISGTTITLGTFFLNEPKIFNNATIRYPLLSKIISAEQDLSIQVHPDDNYAKTHEDGSLGKAECWYILDCPNNAEIVYGHTATTKSHFAFLIENKQWDKLLKRVRIKPGDFINVPPGKIHAITKGTCVFELQQSSDITYRVYDYDRPDSNGQLRPLHIQKSIDVATIPDDNLIIKNINQGILVDNNYFYLYLLNSNQQNIISTLNTNYIQITVINGEATIDNHPLQAGNSAIIYNVADKIIVNGKIKALISYKK